MTTTQEVKPFSQVVELTIERIRLRLNAGEWTERGFARIARIGQGSLNNVLQKRRKPSIGMMDKLCKAARIDPLNQEQP